MKREEISYRFHIQHCLYSATGRNYVVWTNIYVDGQLTRLKMTNPTFISFLRILPHVILMDAVCKTNDKK